MTPAAAAVSLGVGALFGALLQRVQASSPDRIVDMLALRDTRILKFMLLAIGVGAAGVGALDLLGLAHLDIKPLAPLAVGLGGLVFGAGFALAGYCPGTCLVGAAEGRRDAWFTALGGLFGALAYALVHPWAHEALRAPLSLGGVTLASASGVPAGLAGLLFGAAMAAIAFKLPVALRRPGRPPSPEAPAPGAGPGPRPTLLQRLRPLAPGVLAALAVGAAAWGLSLATPALSPLIWAVALGAALANTGRLPKALAPGIAFSARHLLRLAVGLLGLRLALGQVLAVGPAGLAVVLAAVVGTFAFTAWLGKRFGLPRPLSTVLAAGTSICGAAAIVAVAGAVDAREEDTAVGVGAVTLYGTLAMVLYPLLGKAFGLTAEQFGLWAGASIHEVAQVVGAAFSFGAATGAGSAVELATVVKLGRVLTLAPMALLLALTFRRGKASAGGKVPLVPWFIVLFVITMAVRSLGVLPPAAVDALVKGDTFLLAVAMAGLGLDLKWSKIRAAGLKPLWVTGLATVFIGASTFVLMLLLGT